MVLSRENPWQQSLSEVDYEDTVQAILDKYGLTLAEVRNAKRRNGPSFQACMEISTALKDMGMTARNRGRILNCDEWLARYYSNPNHRAIKMRKDRERMASKRKHLPITTRKDMAAGPEREIVL